MAARTGGSASASLAGSAKGSMASSTGRGAPRRRRFCWVCSQLRGDSGRHTAAHGGTLREGGAEADLLPLAGARPFAPPRRDRADEAPVALRDPVRGAFARQRAEGPAVALLQLFRNSRGMPERRLPHSRGIEFKAVVLPQPPVARREGIFRPEIAEHPLEPARFAAGALPHAGGEAPRRAAPRLLLCSDGLTNMVPDAELFEVLGLGLSSAEICKRLVAAANRAGGVDNVTALSIQCR